MEEQIISNLFVCHTADKIWIDNRRRAVGKAVRFHTAGDLLVITAHGTELYAFPVKDQFGKKLHAPCLIWKNNL